MVSKKSVSLERVFNAETPSIARLLLHYFGGNPYHAIARTTAGEISYRPIQEPLTEELIQQHMEGKIALGSYQILARSNQVMWAGWDVDSSDRTMARKYAEKILARIKDVPHLVEFSGSKGYHILILLSEPVPAEKAKAVVDYVRDSEGLPKSGTHHIECYPKQPALSKQQPMGSLLKIPLGQHPKTHERSRLVDPGNGWENGNDQPPDTFLLNTATPEQFYALLKEATDPKKQLVETLIPHWVAGEHHNLCLYLSGYLAHLGWGMQEVIDIITEISRGVGDPDINNRLDTVRDTFKSIEEGRTVKGFSGLSDLLPGGAMKVLVELATRIMTPTLVKQVDSIRLSKGSAFEKVRAAASTIWGDLHERGEVVQTNFHVAYWYDREEHTLIPLESIMWEAIFNQEYGINTKESFGVQVLHNIKMQAFTDARVVAVSTGTVWTGEKLYVCLGSAAVYELDGEDIQTTYNGECGYLFQTDSFAQRQIVPDFKKPVDVWSMLVNDLSFSTSKDAPATPDQQKELLKAWILAYFFKELMPTKPLLFCMGASGSGKTTAMRRIARILEKPDAEVLELVQDKPDSFRSSIASHRLMVLDNMEKTERSWIVDVLNRMSTGENIEIRELYKTNATYVIRPDCFVAMTAVELPFSDETLHSRLLVLNMQQLNSPMPEYLLQENLRKSTDGIWADLLLKLNQVVATLKRDHTQVPPINSRLADFTVFCKRISKSGVLKSALLDQGILSMVDSQQATLRASSPFITMLDHWLDSNVEKEDKFYTASDLFTILEPMAHIRKLDWRWKNPQAFSSHMWSLEATLRKTYGVVKEEHDGSKGRDVKKIRFTALIKTQEDI